MTGIQVALIKYSLWWSRGSLAQHAAVQTGVMGRPGPTQEQEGQEMPLLATTWHQHCLTSPKFTPAQAGQGVSEIQRKSLGCQPAGPAAAQPSPAPLHQEWVAGS